MEPDDIMLRPTQAESHITTRPQLDEALEIHFNLNQILHVAEIFR